MASARVCKHQQQDGMLQMLATNRVQVAEEWQQVVHDTEGADVLERCKKLNEFLSQDFSRLKGNANTQKELQNIMAMLTAQRKQRPACLEQKVQPSSESKRPDKTRSLADSAASAGRHAPVLATDDALDVLAILQEADAAVPQRSSTVHRSISSTGSSFNGSSRPSTGQHSVISSASCQSEHDLSDLIGLLNPTSVPASLPVKAAMTVSSREQVASCQASTPAAVKAAAGSRAAGALAVRQLQEKLREQRADTSTPTLPVGFKALTLSSAQGPAATKQAELPAAAAAGEEERAKTVAAEQKTAAEAAAKKAAADEQAAALAAVRKAAMAAEAQKAAQEAAAKKMAAEAAAQKAAAEAASKKAAAEAAAKQAAAKVAAEKAAAEAAAKKASEAADQAAAAVVLQSCWRSHVAQWHVAQMHSAATCLECAVRRHIAVRQLQQLQALQCIKQHVMARRIQRAWRAWHVTRGWKLGELRGPARCASAEKKKVVVCSSTAAVPVKVRSTADTRLAPQQRITEEKAQSLVTNGESTDPKACGRAASTAQKRSAQVAQQEGLRKQDLGARVVMTASLHRNTQEALAIATQRSAAHRQQSLQRELQ